MEKKDWKVIRYQLDHWENAIVRTVPGVMMQVLCGQDEEDSMIEYQINCFEDCSQTFVHNHKHSFDTCCLQGGYNEKLWKIVDCDTDATTYQFQRHYGNDFDAPTVIRGRLAHVNSRSHYPGNRMHLGVDEYHSISPIENASDRVVTFLVKRTPPIPSNMYILSPSPDIDAPKEKIRGATEEERNIIFNELHKIILQQDPC